MKLGAFSLVLLIVCRAACAVDLSLRKEVDVRAGISRISFVEGHTLAKFIPSVGGGFLAVGYQGGSTVFTAFDIQGRAVLTNFIPFTNIGSIVAAGDGTYVALVSGSVCRLSEAGEVLSSTILTLRRTSYFYEIIPFGDGFLVSGMAPYNGEPAYTFVRFLNESFETGWELHWAGEPRPPTCLRASGSEAFFIGISASSPQCVCGWPYRLVVAQTNGASVLDQSFHGAGLNTEQLVAIVPASDGGYLLAGLSSSPPGADKSSANFGNEDIWIVRVDSSGRKVWDRSFGGVGGEGLIGALPTDDGGFLLLGESYNSGITGNKSVDGDGLWLLKVDGRGIKEAETLFPSLANGQMLRGFPDVYWLASNSSVTDLRITEFTRLVARWTGSPFRLDVSRNLPEWRMLVDRVDGDVEIREALQLGASRFFRAVEVP